MNLFGWILLIGGVVLSVMDLMMLAMQAAMWLTSSRPSWPPMGLSVFWGVTINTGWAGLDKLFNSHITTGLIAIATLIGIGLTILGMKIIERRQRTSGQKDSSDNLTGLE